MADVRSEISVEGVSLRLLQRFMCSNQTWIEEATTLQVARHVMMLTEAEQCSFVRSSSVKEGDIGIATNFVSHAWNGLFRDLVDAVEQHANKGNRTNFYWIDVFSLCQNRGDQPAGDKMWSECFEIAMQKIGSVIVVATPWDCPICVRRSWCLFELYVASLLGLPVDIILPRSEKQRFRQFLLEGGSFLDIFSQIDLSKAESSMTEDKVRIDSLVRDKLGGFGKLNETVLNALREWLVAVAQEEYALLDVTIKSGSELQYNLARLLREVGDLEEALLLFEEYHKVKLSVSGLEDDQVLKSKEMIAGIHDVLGNYQIALAMYESVLGVKVGRHGVDHPEVGDTQVNIANVYHSLGQYEPALKKYLLAHKTYIGAYGDINGPVADAQHNIAVVCESLGRYDDSLDMHLQALKTREAVFGSNHVQTALSLKSIGNVLYRQGRYDDALESYERALRIERAALGDGHLDASLTMNNIASVYQQQGRYDEALGVLAAALEIKEACLGRTHATVAVTVETIGVVLYYQGRYADALAHYERALAIRRAALGGDGSLPTASLKDNIGQAQRRLGDVPAALRTHLDALAECRACVGDRHPKTAWILGNLAKAREAAGDADAARALLAEAAATSEACLGAEHDSTRWAVGKLQALRG